MSSDTIADAGTRTPAAVPPRHGRTDVLTTLAVLTVLVVLGILASLAFAAPTARPGDAPPADFSAARAITHVTEIAQRPHPTGTADNARVRDYIVAAARAAGAEVQVETGEVLRQDQGNPFPTAVVSNVIARIPGSAPGTSGGKALLLVAHYDSVPTGPGAADDGAAVASMLETIRALHASSGVRDDVVFLFTDGEELGSLGATLFVRQHDISGYGAVLNWEARGTHGPVLMFETGRDNSGLIDAFATASSRPIGNSLAYEVYRRMPNDSDFTVFRGAGAAGLNAAFIGGIDGYHSALDTPARLSPDSTQHHGETMLGMIRALGDTDLRADLDHDAVYFDLFARLMVHYPIAWTIPFAVACVLLLLGLFTVGLRRSKLSIGSVLAVSGVCVGAIAGAAVVCFGIWQLVMAIRPELAALTLSEPYNSAGFVAGFAAATAGLLVVAARFIRGRRPAELLGGVLLTLAVLLLVSALVVPGASYLLQWPVTAGLPALWFAVRHKNPVSPMPWLVLLALPAAVTIVLFVPLAGALISALGTALAWIAMAIAALGMILLLPVLARLPRHGWIGGTGLLTALVILGVSVAGVGFAPGEPRRDSLVYVRDLADGQAAWISGDSGPDPWTARVLGEQPGHTSTTRYFPEFGDKPMLTAPAPPVDLAPPTVRTVRDTVAGDTRTLRLRAESQRQAWKLQIRLPVEQLRACTVAGTRLDTGDMAPGPSGDVVFQHFGQTGVEITCEVVAGSRLPVEVTDFTSGHPPAVAALLGPRPDDAIPVAFGFTPEESTVVRQIVTL
jgi:hypothetical protein